MKFRLRRSHGEYTYYSPQMEMGNGKWEKNIPVGYMNNLHVRFTPYDISGYTFEWLSEYSKFILAQEDVDDNLQPLQHYHIYIETTKHIDTVRDKLKKYLCIPAAGRGVNNKYYALISKWEDIAYIVKYNNILKSEGYTESELMKYVISGKKKYLEKERKTELRGEIAPAALEVPKKEKVVKVPYQQQIIALASADWHNYKKTTVIDCLNDSHKRELIKFVCKAMREVSRGINQHLVNDIARAVLFDDIDWRDRMVDRLLYLSNI